MVANKKDLDNLFGENTKKSSDELKDLGLKETKRTYEDSPAFKRQQQQQAENRANARREGAKLRSQTSPKIQGGNTKGTIAVDSKGVAKDLGKWSNRTLQEDIALIKKASIEEVKKAINGLSRGIADSELAKSIASIGRSEAGRNALKVAKIGGGLLGLALTAFDTIQAGKQTKENWNAEGADWRSRGADIQATLSTPLHTLAGALTGGGIGAGTGAITGAMNTARQRENAELIRQQNIKRKNAENELREMGLSPKATNEEIRQKFDTHPDAELKEYMAELDRRFDNELATEEALRSNPNISTENRLREIQAQKAMTGSSGGNNNIPPATPPVMDDNNSNNDGNNNIQPAVTVPDVVNRVGASVGMNTQDNNNNNDKIQDVQNTEDTNIQQPVTDQQPTFEEQLQQSIINPTGNLSTEELSNRLADIANQYRQTAQNHYLYNGQAIDPTVGQYNVDPRALRMAQMGDMVANTLGLDVNRTKNLLGIANAEYQANMGNQLGVPYENYVLAMGERRKAELDSYSQQMNHQLELAKQQATTLSEKLKYLQAQEKLKQDTALGYAKIDADVQNNIRNNQTDIAVQDLSNQGMLTDRQMRELAETDRQNRLQPIQEQKATADLIEALSWVSDPNQRAWLVMTNPDLQMRLFGRRINPQNANDINALNAFVKGSYGIDMNNMGRVNQQQGILQNIANRIRGNN